MASKHSAGILLFRRGKESEVEFLLVHPGGPFWRRKDQGAWTIPKGQIEGEEEARACAIRELEEELGQAPPLDPEQLIELGSIKQRAGKVVEAWAAEAEFDPAELASNTFSMEWPPRSGEEQEFPEVDKAEWFDLETARQKILPAQAELLDRLLERLGSTDGERSVPER
ncbi:MAG TPA: NUDIX domain-containing protein [Solirubrobacterales bacterium]|jgi:predicted NUDIX family NTP pyrophosphohydrolase|nr:NUDIX domain-containing protein [Solirubrobacterales bacterium]